MYNNPSEELPESLPSESFHCVEEAPKLYEMAKKKCNSVSYRQSICSTNKYILSTVPFSRWSKCQRHRSEQDWVHGADILAQSERNCQLERQCRIATIPDSGAYWEEWKRYSGSDWDEILWKGHQEFLK